MERGIDSRELVVRRTRAADAEEVASFVNRALGGRVEVVPQRVIARLGDVAFLLAEEEGELRGLIGWHVENLVACVTDLLILPARERERVGQALFDEMEAQAKALQAEAILVFLPPSAVSRLSAFCETLGYLLHTVGELPQSWREMAEDAGRVDEDEIPIKQLRADRVVRPL